MWPATIPQLRMCERIVSWMLTRGFESGATGLPRRIAHSTLSRQAYDEWATTSVNSRVLYFLDLRLGFLDGQIEPQAELTSATAGSQRVDFHQFPENALKIFDASIRGFHLHCLRPRRRDSATVDDSQIVPLDMSARKNFQQLNCELIEFVVVDKITSFESKLCPSA
jgi:hypothetical protein